MNNSLRNRLSDVRERTLPLRHRATAAGVIVTVPLALGMALTHSALVRVVLLFGLVPAIVGLGLLAPAGLIYGLAAWLVALGLIRRLIDTTAPTANGGLGDPLLLVGPIVVIVLTWVAAQRGAFRSRSPLANAVLLLTLLILVEAANPLQGSPLVGIAGLLFLLVPVLGFWIGRGLVDSVILRRLFVVLAILSVPAVAYGLFQQYRGLPSWDAAWVASSGYAALHVGTAIRSFGTFGSSSEYVTYLAIGTVICASALTRRSVAPVALVVGGLLAYGVFYDSSRGTVVLVVAALALMWGARRRLPIAPAIIGGVAGMFVLLAVAGHFASTSSTSPTAQNALAQHQINGLANPFNSQDSTLNGHFSEMVAGLRSSLTNPVGYGTGSVTLAGSRYGGTSHGTEVDPSNFGVALGLPGLVLYLLIVGLGLASTYRSAAQSGRWWTLAALGVLIVVFLQWSNGAQYAVAWLPWLVLGWSDGQRTWRPSGPMAQTMAPCLEEGIREQLTISLPQQSSPTATIGASIE